MKKPIFNFVVLFTTSFCRTTAPHGTDAALQQSPTVAAVSGISSPQLFHTNLSNEQRVALLAHVRVAQIMSAPGHAALREPQKILELAEAIRSGREQGFRNEPILIGVFTDQVGATVKVRSVEVLDGNHRLVAGLYSGKWLTVQDIPADYLQVRVNGWEAGGKESLPRWIPLDVAESSSIPKDQWFRVPDAWYPKNPSAQIPGSIASIDPVFREDFRGVPIGQVLKISLLKIGKTVPPELH